MVYFVVRNFVFDFDFGGARGNQDSNFRQGVGGRGSPGGLKKTSTYMLAGKKKSLNHLSEPLGATGSSSLLGAQTEVCAKLRCVQFSFLDQKWAI
jgi:hypothetical protein